MNETNTELVETLLTDGGEMSPKQLARNLPILDFGYLLAASKHDVITNLVFSYFYWTVERTLRL